MDPYHPDFFVLSKDEMDGPSLFQILLEDHMVAKVGWVQKFINLFDAANYGTRRLISVYTKSTNSLNTLIRRLEKNTSVAQLFDADLSHVQQYLFKTFRIESISEVDVEYDDNFHTDSITNIEEDTCKPQPFSICIFVLRRVK